MEWSKKYKDLEIEEDIVAQKRLWKFQKFGTIFVLLVILSSFIGLISPGPLSKNKSGNDIIISYDVILHYRDARTLRIDVPSHLVRQNELSVSIDKDYVSKIEIEKIIPHPGKALVSGNEVKYTFTTSPQTDTTIYIHFRPEFSGTLSGYIQASQGQKISFRQFVFP